MEIFARSIRLLRFRRYNGVVLRALLASVLISPLSALAQQSADEHASHHPPGASASAQAMTRGSAAMDAAAPAESSSTAKMQTNGSAMPDQSGQGMMGEMMREMMGSGQKQVYPSLMAMPDMSSQRREEVKHLSEDRIYTGSIQLQDAQKELAAAVRVGNHAGAAQAIQSAREALGQLESGVAAHRLLSEGTPPQNTALLWFKESMGLTGPSAQHGLFGLSWFHYLTMFFLAAFLVAMLALYFFKTRRAAALVRQLSGGQAPESSVSGGLAPSSGAPPKQLEEFAVPQDIAPSRPNSWTGALLVGRIFQETPYVKTFRLVDPLGSKLPFSYLPGQFLTLTVSPNGQQIKRSYTISSSPTHRDYCEVTVRHEQQGVVSSYLNNLVHEGELLQVTAPSGKFTFVGDEARSIVLIGGGVGITPMMSVVRYLTDRSWPGDIYLIYGCKSDTDVIFREEIDYLARRFPNLHATLIVDRAETGNWPHLVGRISREVLQAAVPEIAARHVHLCGPKPMMDAVKAILAELNVPSNQVETETFIGKEIPMAAVTTVADASPKFAVSFARSNKTAPIAGAKTVLEAAEDIGVNIEYSCRSGTCGICKVKLLSGTVTMDVEDGLEPADKAQHVVLACQAKATSDISVDA